MIINQELTMRINESSSYSRDEFGRITAKVKELTLAVQSKDEDIAEWDQKYSSLYSAYEQLYHNYQITKTEYDVTLANIKSYEAKYQCPYLGSLRLETTMKPSLWF
jgi:chromosome segregation ATPase